MTLQEEPLLAIKSIDDHRAKSLSSKHGILIVGFHEGVMLWESRNLRSRPESPEVSWCDFEAYRV